MSDFDLRMHGSKDIGNYQPTGAGVGIKLYVLAVGSGTNTVESDRTLDSGIDAFDSDSNDAPLVLRKIYEEVYVPVG
jgi:hypothetical protein